MSSHDDKVRELLDLLGARKRAVQIFDQLTEQLSVLSQIFPPQLIEGMRGALSSEETFDGRVRIYKNYLSEEDVDGLIAFYKSEVGQKWLLVEPQLTKEVMEESERIQEKVMADLMPSLSTMTWGGDEEPSA